MQTKRPRSPGDKPSTATTFWASVRTTIRPTAPGAQPAWGRDPPSALPEEVVPRSEWFPTANAGVWGAVRTPIRAAATAPQPAQYPDQPAEEPSDPWVEASLLDIWEWMEDVSAASGSAVPLDDVPCDECLEVCGGSDVEAHDPETDA